MLNLKNDLECHNERAIYFVFTFGYVLFFRKAVALKVNIDN